MSPSPFPRFTLTNTFTHTTPTHTLTLNWTCIGPPSKPPLILIHGFPWSSRVWHDLTSTLLPYYTIYIYDHPGFGSSPPPTRLSTHTHCQDLDLNLDLDETLTLRASASAALIKSWSLPSAPHIIAHDNGGLVALRLFLEHSIPFASLCLIDVVAVGPFGSPFFKSVAENRGVFEVLPSVFLEGLVRSYIRTAVHERLRMEEEDELAEQWMEGGEQGPQRFLQEIVQANFRDVGGLEERYGSVGERVPVKVIWGGEDGWIPRERGEVLAEKIGAKELVFVEEAGHLVMIDQPSKLAFEVGVWLVENS